MSLKGNIKKHQYFFSLKLLKIIFVKRNKRNTFKNDKNFPSKNLIENIFNISPYEANLK